jgi:hypothetical protein
MVRKAGGRTGGKGVGDKTVSVHILPPDGHKHGPRAGLAAIGDKAGYQGGTAAGEQLAAAYFCNLCKFQLHKYMAPF